MHQQGLYTGRWLLLLSIATAPCFGQTKAPDHKTKLSMDDAKKIALTHEAGEIRSAELEHEKGRWIYSLDIVRAGKTHEVNVDANTGRVVEDKVETAADEARETAAEKKSK